MGWSNCGKNKHGQDIGYGFEATCDHPGCNRKIDRGIAHVCGGMHNGTWEIDGQEGESCGKYFCGEHLYVGYGHFCKDCQEEYLKEYHIDCPECGESVHKFADECETCGYDTYSLNKEKK